MCVVPHIAVTRYCVCSRSIRRCRREGTVGIYVSVHVNDAMRCVHVACDGGRICRPLIVVEHGVPKLTVRTSAMKLCSLVNGFCTIKFMFVSLSVHA